MRSFAELGRLGLRLLAGVRMIGPEGCNWFVCFLCCPFDQSQCPPCCLPYCHPGNQVQAEEAETPSAADSSDLPEDAPEEAA